MTAISSWPRIGISSRYVVVGRFQKAMATPTAYLDLISMAGGLPIPIPMFDPRAAGITEEDVIEETIDILRLDGVVLIGGEDIDPSQYGQEPHPKLDRIDPDRDRFDLSLVRVCARRQRPIPMFGICRGMQILNVGLGGDLTQHVGNHMMLTDGLPDINRKHLVRLDPNSRFAEFMGVPEFLTNSYHHQHVRRAGDRLRIVGWAEDGVPEMIEHDDCNYACIGIQSHPEIHPDPFSLRMMRWFVDQSRRSA